MKIKTSAISRLRDVINFEIDVLTSYVNRVESDVKDGVETYTQNINVVHEEVIETGNLPYYHVVKECEGLNSETYSFESVFEEYFPQLQRSSALITLWGFFEYQLIRLCKDLQKENSLPSFKGDKIAEATIYLKNVVGITFDVESSEYIEILNIKRLRNRFVHEDGFINATVSSYVQTNKYLSGDLKIIIGDGYLHHVITSYKSVFEIIYNALTSKYTVRQSI